MCPGSTEPLNMSTSIFLGVKAAGATLPSSYALTSRPRRPVTRILYFYMGCYWANKRIVEIIESKWNNVGVFLPISSERHLAFDYILRWNIQGDKINLNVNIFFQPKLLDFSLSHAKEMRSALFYRPVVPKLRYRFTAVRFIMCQKSAVRILMCCFNLSHFRKKKACLKDDLEVFTVVWSKNRSSRFLVNYSVPINQTTRCHIPEDRNLIMTVVVTS